MLAYHLVGTGGINDLRSAELPVPSPRRGQILIRMRAASLNFRDLLVAKGGYGAKMPMPIIPLSDGCGEVVAVGDDVSRFIVGDRACPTFSNNWTGGPVAAEHIPTSLGGFVDGVLAEYVVCDATMAVKPPAHLSFEQAACLPCAGVTAWSALNGPRAVKAGETVLTLGTGGVSMFAVQFARAAGARVIATSSSNEKLAQLRALGADDTINYASHPDWEHKVLRLTDGRGVDHVVEIGGGGTLPKSIASTAVNGQVHLIGVLTSGQINPLSIMSWKTIRGILVGSRDDFEAMNRMIEVHRIEPVIDEVFEFDRAADAYRKLEAAKHVGKIVIRVS